MLASDGEFLSVLDRGNFDGEYGEYGEDGEDGEDRYDGEDNEANKCSANPIM